jgi:DnaJ-class molecular chaperone
MPSSSARDNNDKRARFWRELGLLPGAPECVIKAAHRHLIEIHHPDRGGSDRKAKSVNAAHDEVKGQGSAAN